VSFAAVLQRLRTLENPYPGLRPFTTEESHLFFGRDQQIAELVARLERNRFVAVVGVSGGGKSSLVRAGLIPALGRAQLSEAGRRWRMVVTRPAGAPYERLAADLTKAGLDPAPLEESSHGLIEIARQLASDESLLVIVDQFEELFRYKELGLAGDGSRQEHDVLAADAAEFVQLLLAAARHHPPVYIVLTMRSDYLGDCAEFRDLPETLNDCQYLVPRMTREQRKEAILGPLGRLEIEPALVQRLLNVAGDEPDQLPVLQHALMRTWNHWYADDSDHKRRIELKDYDAIGGLGDALNRHADELVSSTRQDITAAIFKRLTAKGRSSRERRNPATLAELWAVCLADTPERQGEVNAVVDHFRRGEATFLVPRDGPLHADTYVDITHESLIRQWKTLRDRWLPEEQASAKTFLDLVDRARNWSEKKGELLFGLDLGDALQWDQRRNRSSAWAKHYASEAALENVLSFIRASEERRREEVTRRRMERRRRRAFAAAMGLLVIAIPVVAGLFQYREARIAREAAFEAQILSVPSVRDPLTRALLLAELGPHARTEHLAIYQEAAAAAIPFAVFRYPDNERAVGAGFLSGNRTAVVMADGSLWSWRSDGYGDSTTRAIVAGAPPTSGSKPLAASRLTTSAISRDGHWIAAGLENGAVWLGRSDAAAGSQLTSGDPKLGTPVSAVAFSRDGRQLAVGYSDHLVRVWELDPSTGHATNTRPTELAGGHQGAITGIDFDQAGARVVTGALDGTIRVWTVHDPARRPINLGDGDDQVTCVAFSPDGVRVLSGYESGAVRIQRTDEPATKETSRILEHASRVTSAAFSPDGTQVVTASTDYTARVWTLRPRGTNEDEERAKPSTVGAPIVLGHDDAVTAVAFSADGTWLVTTSADGTARVWPGRQSEPRIVGLHDDRVESVAFSADGKHVLSASDDLTARLWSLGDISKPQVLAGHGNWVRSAAFNPSDSQKVMTASDDGTLRLWDLTAPGTRHGRVSQEASTVFEGAFDRQGARVVTAVRDNTARVWATSDLVRGGSALETGEQSDILELHHDDWVLGAAFSSDGSKIVTASRDGTVRIWEPTRNRRDPVKVFSYRDTTAVNAAFSPDGTRVVAAFSDRVARVWRVDGSGQVMSLRHRGDVNEALFSSNGNWIATASRDGTAGLWSAQDGGERLVLQHGTEAVRAVAFDSSDTRVVTGTAEGIVRVWRITIPALLDYLDHATTACLPPPAHVRFLGESEATASAQYRTCERRWGRTPTDETRLNGTPGAAGAAR
jgi:WD40 repeat protein